MWKEVLQTTKPQIGLNIKDIPTDDEDDCCQMAKDMWKIYWIKQVMKFDEVFPNDLYNFTELDSHEAARDFYYNDFDITKDEDILKMYDLLYVKNGKPDGFAHRTSCENFRKWHGLPQKIRDAWDKCEGK